MPAKKKTPPRIPPAIATVVRLVTTRLSRMEGLLVEMRHEQDVKLKKIHKLGERVDELANTIGEMNASLRRVR